MEFLTHRWDIRAEIWSDGGRTRGRERRMGSRSCGAKGDGTNHAGPRWGTMRRLSTL